MDPILPFGQLGYSIGCRLQRDGLPPPASVHSLNDEAGWSAVVEWPNRFGVTIGFTGPFPTRREAVLSMRAGLRLHRQQVEAGHARA